MSLADLERYREIIDDWPAFVAALGRPEPTTLRVNRLRTDVAAVRRALESEGFVLGEVEGQPWFLRVIEGPRNVADTYGHWAGWFYIQQASTGVAAELLGARPGERVLDLCAAPGGKTGHLAEMMEGRGTVVACEVNEGRIRALLGNLYRLGTPNVLVISGDGRDLPDGALFDRVLVDVPCSAQGTIRKKAGRLPARSNRFMKKITRAQEALLRRAIELTRPGGVVLYVTCTFGPDENEAVVSRVLADAPVDVEAMEPPMPHAPGVLQYGKREFDARLAGAVRLYPHHLDSGGLFLCRLRKAGGATEPEGASDPGADGEGEPGEGSGPMSTPVGWTPVADVFPDEGVEGVVQDDVDRLLEVLVGYYGVAAEAFEGLAWVRRGRNLWLHGCELWPLDAWSPGGHWRPVAIGLRAADLSGDGPPRPTNDLLQWLDAHITRHRVDLSPEMWRDVLDGRETHLPGIERGYVALGLQTPTGAHVVGWGFVRDGRLKDHVPGGQRKWLRKVVSGPEE